MSATEPTPQPAGEGAHSLHRMVSLLERSICYCNELRNNYVAKHGFGDHTTDILEHIYDLEAEVVRLKQANDKGQR